MKVMRRDVNFGLLLIIIATLICFSSFAVYYQKSFKNLSTDYYGKLDELNKVADQLTSEKTRLNQTSYQLQVKEKRESELSNIYTDLRTEKEKLEADLKTTQDSLNAERDKVRQTQDELTQKMAELTSTQNDLQKAEAESEHLKDEVNNLEDQIDGMCSCS